MCIGGRIRTHSTHRLGPCRVHHPSKQNIGNPDSQGANSQPGGCLGLNSSPAILPTCQLLAGGQVT